MSGSDIAPQADPMVGQYLGKDYRVLGRVGVGGMGVIYLVEHEALGKRFAAKVLSHELAASAEARARFEIEAHAASQLEHENIVTVTGYGLTDDGRPYILMEYLRGRTLDDRLLEGPLSVEEIVAVVLPVARALAEAHAEGIVHRDVKPENIFLTQRSGGRWGIKVLDFGIAKVSDGRSRMTKSGQTLGSPVYMAPEACRGGEVDHRADIYSLGVLMYLLWCGRVPFDDDNFFKVLHMQVSDPVPPPRRWQPDMSPELEAVIMRALEKEPDDRFLSIGALLLDLERALPPGADRLLIEAARGRTTIPSPDSASTSPVPRVPTKATDPGIGFSMAPPTAATTASSTPPIGAARSRWSGRLTAVAALVLAAGFAGSYLATAPSREPTTLPASDPPPVAAASAVEPPAPPTPAPSPVTIDVRVRTAAPGATVSFDGRVLGTTPLDIELPASAESGELFVEQAGFRPWSRSVSLVADIDLDAELVAVENDPPPPARSEQPRPRQSGRGAASRGVVKTERARQVPDLDIRPSR